MEGQAASSSGVEPDAPDPTAAAGAQQGQSSQHGGGGGSRRQQRYDDHFMIFVWKVEMCKRMDKHDREQCPYAHPGELARRRHPSLYQALPCPEARAKKICPRLENCNCSHSTFEFWLHPDRYKTFMCERGEACDRPICFFAHSSDELRELPQGLRRTQVPGRPPAASAAPSSSSSFGHPPGASQHQQGAAGPQSGWGYAGSSIPSHQQQSEQHRGAAAPQAPGAGAQGRTMAACLPAGMPGSSRQGSAAGARVPEGHRGATVAVVPAGPSVWQQNSMLQNESGEAPNLEELCAAVARMATPGQQQTDEQPGGLMYLPLPQQQQQQVGAIGALPPQYPLALMGGQQVAPGLMPVGQVFAQQQQQQQQQAIPQPVLLPGGQVVYVQLPPQQGGSAGAADQFPWASMQPRG